MTPHAYALLSLVAVMAVLLWLQMRRGDRLCKQIGTYQIDALNAHHAANQWRALADQAIDLTNDLSGRVTDGNLDVGLLIHTAGKLQRARQELDRRPLKHWHTITANPHGAWPVSHDVTPTAS